MEDQSSAADKTHTFLHVSVEFVAGGRILLEGSGFALKGLGVQRFGNSFKNSFLIIPCNGFRLLSAEIKV